MRPRSLHAFLPSTEPRRSPRDRVRRVRNEVACRNVPDIRARCPAEKWCYGYAFWTNDNLVLWPALPDDAFAASGAGRKLIWVCPSLDMVVAQSPGVYEDHADDTCRELLGRIAAACS